MVNSITDGNNLILWGDALLRISKPRDSHHVEIVAHPSPTMTVSFRQARAPYVCMLHLADGRDVDVDLACAEDWGDIQECLPDECKRPGALGWGNDSDGHVEIVRVTDADGKDIPLSEFERDVNDFTIYHED